VSEAKTYRLSTVADFQAIPPERLDSCLCDFIAWLALHRATRIMQAHGHLEGLTLPSMDCFEWLDDGKHDLTIIISHEGKELSREVFTFAAPDSTSVGPDEREAE
jgi:hypothetical protein